MVRWQAAGRRGRLWCRLDTYYYETNEGEPWSVELWEYAVGGEKPFVAYAYDPDSGDPGPEAHGATGEEALEAMIQMLESGEWIDVVEDADEEP